MTPRHVRALRGAAAAWIATVLAATSHTLSGGGAPSALLVGVLGVLASPVAIALVGRRLSVWRAAATVIASQALFHVAFAVTAGVDASALSGHVHHGSLDSGGTVAGVLPDGRMIAGHVVAAAATILALYCGERMLRALGRGIHLVLRRAAVRAAVPVRAVRVAAQGLRVTPARGVVLSDVSRRGPPSSVLAAF